LFFCPLFAVCFRTSTHEFRFPFFGSSPPSHARPLISFFVKCLRYLQPPFPLSHLLCCVMAGLSMTAPVLSPPPKVLSGRVLKETYFLRMVLPTLLDPSPFRVPPMPPLVRIGPFCESGLIFATVGPQSFTSASLQAVPVCLRQYLSLLFHLP